MEQESKRMTELKPCPFCKNSDDDMLFVWTDIDYTKYVFCNRCGAQGPRTSSKEGAIKKWNGE